MSVAKGAELLIKSKIPSQKSLESHLPSDPPYEEVDLLHDGGIGDKASGLKTRNKQPPKNPSTKSRVVRTSQEWGKSS